MTRALKPLLLTLSLAGCAPALVTGLNEGTLTKSYFDTLVAWQNPYIMHELEPRLERFILNNKKQNRTELLLEEMKIAQAECKKNGKMYICLIKRNIVESGCFRSNCSKSRRIWTVTVSWIDLDDQINPKVKINHSIEQLETWTRSTWGL
jgi:hypothetical protein